MGVFPEPALCADDVSRLVPSETNLQDNSVVWLLRAEHQKQGRTFANIRRRTIATLLAGLMAGFCLPQNALAPAAAAHDRIDERAFAAQDLAARTGPDKPADWGGVPLLEQEPATAALIESDLAALPQPRNGPGDEILRFGDMSVPRRIVETILRASAEAGVDPVYMMALADKESSFATRAKAATSSAEGLFQFVSATWLEMIRDFGARYGYESEASAVTGRGAGITVTGEAMRERVLGLRRDPYVAALMAAELIKRDRARIEARIGRDLKTSELYLAHFLGTTSAGRFLALSAEKPEKDAQKEFRSAARANRSLFTEKAGKGRRSLTVAEVYERIDGMIDRRLSQYEGVTALAGPAPAELPAPPVPSAEGRLQVTDASLPTAQ
ncbi:transglycosylase SLT domain-containing protein [Methylobacterium planeticum]|uniref:Lytic transglycosylase domain-containing protein n=1 Tax=Methylobacterium planeticum TaxID=2615211 RepID=A0A6N6MN00_9HYPH|nr:transglycosylase SLT domain-containing protein [Methylobacterium planeticum]KAB1070664.1 lytic transglycosylase domain-containing protein [Methylobacterium planeticum]